MAAPRPSRTVVAMGRDPGTTPTFLVGMDGSEQALAAARFTEALARARNADVVTVPPTGGLHEAAERLRATLVAVGATHRYGVGRLAPGGVAEQLLSGSPRPVLVVGADTPDAPVGAVGVGYDAEAGADDAVAAGMGLAVGLGAELRLVSVVEPDGDGARGSEAAGDARRRDREERLAAVARGLPAGTRARTLLGHPGSALLRVGDEVGLLVLGSRSRAPAGSVLAGSVARRVVAHARCPVLVVPRSADRPPSRGRAVRAGASPG